MKKVLLKEKYPLVSGLSTGTTYQPEKKERKNLFLPAIPAQMHDMCIVHCMTLL